MRTKLRHPIRAIREPFGTAGLIVAVVALVAALAGGAYAATGLNGKQKKEVEKIAKKYAGKPGAAGAQGAAGANGAPGAAGQDGLPGADGAAGKTGATGATGANGKSVTLSAAGACATGGTKLTVGTENAEVCNGAKGDKGEKGDKGDKGDPGDPWTLNGTLPSGATETGTWTLGTVTVAPKNLVAEPIYAGISFAVPLAATLDEKHVHYINTAGLELPFGTPPTNCSGTAAEPKADAGHLCVYAGLEVGLALPGIEKPSTNAGAPGASTAGALIKFFVPETEKLEPKVEKAEAGYSGAAAYGTWAVTGAP